MENGLLTSTTPTARASNSWSSLRRRNLAAIPTRRDIRRHDAALFFLQVSSLFTPSSQRILCESLRATEPLACPFLPPPDCSSARPRQATPEYRRRNHRLQLRSRRPHRLRRSPQH